MNLRTCSRFVLASLIGLCAQLAVPSTASGQAWIPAKRTGIVTVAFRNLFVQDHTKATGERFYAGTISQNIGLMNFDFGVSKRVALNFSAPIIFANYKGPAPHRDPGQERSIDDGGYHGGFQDFRGGARYHLVRDRPLDVSPFVEVIIPSHAYPVYGHAQIGRNLKEFVIGAYVGRDLDPWLPKAYFQTRVAYAIAEGVIDHSTHQVHEASHNRTNIDTEVGYQLTQRVGISGLVYIQKHHGGLPLRECSPLPYRACYTDEEWHVHGQLFKSDAIDLGAGVSYLLSESTSIFGSFLYTPWSRNSHPIARGFTLGLNWRFDTRPRPPSRS